MKLTTKILIALIEFIVSAFAIFITYKLVIKELGLDSLGIWSLLLSFFSLTSIGNAGFASSVVKFVAKYEAKRDTIAIKDVIETTLITVAVVSFLMIGLILLLLFFVPSVFTEQEILLIRPLVTLVALAFLLGIIGRIFLSVLDGLNLIHLRSYIGIISKIVFVITSVLLIKSSGLKGLAISTLIQNFLIMALGIFFVRRKITNLHIFFPAFNKIIFKEIFKYGFNFQIISIFQTVIDPIIKIQLKKFGGLAFVGLFEVLYKYLLKTREATIVITTSLVPTVASMHEIKPFKLNAFFLKVSPILFTITITAFVFVFSLLPIYVAFVKIDLHYANITVALIICAGLLFNSIGILPFMFNLGIGTLNLNTISSIVLALLCILLTPIMGFFFGGNGILVGWAIAQLSANFLLLLIFLNKNNIKISSLINLPALKMITLTVIMFSIITVIFTTAKSSLMFTLLLAISASAFTLVMFYLSFSVVKEQIKILYEDLVQSKT